MCESPRNFFLSVSRQGSQRQHFLKANGIVSSTFISSECFVVRQRKGSELKNEICWKVEQEKNINDFVVWLNKRKIYLNEIMRVYFSEWDEWKNGCRNFRDHCYADVLVCFRGLANIILTLQSKVVGCLLCESSHFVYQIS